ncbi:YciI family protein [soil metagenome]
MQYLLIITLDENGPGASASSPESQQAWGDFTRDIMQSGVLVGGASLQPTSTATTVVHSMTAGTSIVDGPFAETKEQFAGYYQIDAADLDAALEWAKKIPVGNGSVEVRPIAQMPDAEGNPQVVN